MVPAGFSASDLRLRVSWPRDRPPPRSLDELVHARGRPQIDEPGQDVDEISLRIDSWSACRPDELNDVGIEIDPRCGHPMGKLDGSPTPGGPNHLFTWRRRVAQGTGVAGSGPLPLRDERLWVVGRFMTTKIKREPLGRPTRWGSLSSERKI